MVHYVELPIHLCYVTHKWRGERYLIGSIFRPHAKRKMEKLRDIFCALLMGLYMSHVGDSRLYVPDWDRGLEGCPVPSFENVKVSSAFF